MVLLGQILGILFLLGIAGFIGYKIYPKIHKEISELREKYGK
jgi:hypothetical protein